MMLPDEIGKYLCATFDEVVPKSSWGETSFFVNPGRQLPSGTYFATIKEQDGENDKGSNLNRDGVFRLSFGPGRTEFEKLFGKPPSRPAKGGIIEGPWDFSAIDKLTPHPVYGWMSWLCILSPSPDSFHKIKPLLNAAHIKAHQAVMKRLGKSA